MKHIGSALTLAVLILTACAAPAMPAPVPTDTSAPTETPMPPPTETSVPTETPIPSPTPDPLIFKDDFEGSLAEGWEWTRENNTRWSLTNAPGWLEILARNGYVGDGTMENIFLRQAPEGNFELETLLKFAPASNFQIAGLIIYESAANYALFGRAFCGGPAICVGDGFYFDQQIDGNFGGENFATAAPEMDTVYLRLRREGTIYTAYASEDGAEWRVIGAHTGGMNPMFIGLVAGQAQSSRQPAQFDYFIVNALP